MYSQHGAGMKYGNIRIYISLFVTLFGFMTGFDVQAGERFNDRIELAGDILTVALPISAAGLTLCYKDGQGIWEFGESAALAMGTTFALKFAINKTRPNGEGQSFPSGHATISFTSAEFMCQRYGWEYGLPAHALATFVAYSRGPAGRHYSVDVIGGAAIGIVSSYLITNPYKGWIIEPEAGYSYFGISLNHSL
jgi:membrane-associated phospholipid phosphatase